MEKNMRCFGCVNFKPCPHQKNPRLCCFFLSGAETASLKFLPQTALIRHSFCISGGFYIDLEFTQFDVENYEHCSYDYVTVADSNNTVGKYCGKENKLDSNLPTKPIVLKTNSVSVQFVTDHSNEEVFHGFQAHFAAKGSFYFCLMYYCTFYFQRCKISLCISISSLTLAIFSDFQQRIMSFFASLCNLLFT